MDYYTIQISSDLYNELVKLLQERVERSDSYLEIKSDMDKISYLKYEKDAFTQKKARQDYRAEIEQSTIDGFIRYLIQVKHLDATRVVGTIREYYDYISSMNDSYITAEKKEDIMTRINEIAYDDEVDEMPTQGRHGNRDIKL